MGQNCTYKHECFSEDTISLSKQNQNLACVFRPSNLNLHSICTNRAVKIISHLGKSFLRSIPTFCVLLPQCESHVSGYIGASRARSSTITLHKAQITLICSYANFYQISNEKIAQTIYHSSFGAKLHTA